MLGGLGIWVLVSERAALPLRVKIALGAATGIALLMLLQATPLPAPVARLLAPPVAEAREAVAAVLPELARSWYPLSLSPADTWDALARFAAYALLGVATLAAVRRSRDLLFLGIAFAAAWLFQAVYGAAEFLSGRQQIFGYVKVHYLDAATGTFNENKGIVYVGTDEGLTSFETPYIKPLETFDELFVYPNPYKIKSGNNLLTIDGLIRDTDIKILTIDGTLVAELFLSRRKNCLLGW